MLTLRRKLAFSFLIIFLSFLIIVYSILPRLLPSQAPSTVTVKVTAYDYYSLKPIGGLALSLSLTTKDSYNFTISGVSDVDGTVTQELSSPTPLTLPVSTMTINLTGRWVLVKVVGDETWNAAEERWKCVDPQAFALNMSKYVFSEVKPLSKQSESRLVLEMELHLTPGKLVGIYNPIPEARRFDWRLRADSVNSNFVEFEGRNLAVVPAGKPLFLQVGVSYLQSAWNLDISIDIGDRKFVDLTPSFVRALFYGQLKELTQMLDTLKPHGFQLDRIYKNLDQMRELYDKAALDIEAQKYDSAMINLRRATNLYLDAYTRTASIYANTLGWVLGMLSVLILFSLMLSYMITEGRRLTKVLFLLSISVITPLFILTQPHLKLFIFEPSVITRSYSIEPLLGTIQTVLIAILILPLITLQRLRDFVWETFEVSIRNLRRRRMRTGLALFTVLVISASAMCLLTFTALIPSYHFPLSNLKPMVNNGLTVYKSEIVSVVPSGPAGPAQPSVTTSNIPLQPYETEWFSVQGWVEDLNVYGIKRVKLSRADGFILSNFSTFNLVIVNPSFMEEYHHVSQTLNLTWITPEERSMVLVGSRIASRYDLRAGSEILLNDRKFLVKAIFDEKTAIHGLRDIDGDFFLFKITDPLTGEMEDGSFLFGSLNDFTLNDFLTYRISIVLKTQHAENTTRIAEAIQGLGYDFLETMDAGAQVKRMTTYVTHVISAGSVTGITMSFPTVTVAGPWQNQLVLMALVGLILFANTLGTVVERRSDARTMFTVGASPTRVRLMFITEGLTLGIIGGMFGYIFGYLLVKYSNITLPTLVEEGLVGGSPFIIATSTAVIASLIGCLLPSGAAVRAVVPSGRLRQRMGDIVTVKGGKAFLEVPLRVGRSEQGEIGKFLEELSKEYKDSKSSLGLGVNQVAIKEKEKETIYEITLFYISDRVSNFRVSIHARVEEDLQVTIEPIDAYTLQTCRWTVDHRYNLNGLSSTLREEILSFIDWKRKIKTK